MKKRFINIGKRLSLVFAVSTIIPLLLFCLYFYTSLREYYREDYISKSETSLSVAIQNINHYIATCVTSAKSVYYNSEVQDLMADGTASDFNSIESKSSEKIMAYLLSVYAATPDAVQLRLAAYRLNKSFLLTPRNLQRYIRTADFADEKGRTTATPNQILVETVHTIHSYGHMTTYSLLSETAPGEYVFSIHLPIYDLPVLKHTLGMLSVDIPISFIRDSSRFTIDEEEVNYVIDAGGRVIFSTDSSMVGQTVQPGDMIDVAAGRSAVDTALNVRSANGHLVLSNGFGSPYLDWYLVKIVPSHVIYQVANKQLIGLLLSFALCLTAAVIFNSLLAMRYMAPLRKATSYMNAIRADAGSETNKRLSEYVVYERNDEIGVLLKGIDDMLTTINDFTIRQYKLDILNKTTELKMLQAQINPHFIYNTLQCLATMSLKNNDRDFYDYISALGHMMQYAMETNQPTIRLYDEVQHVRRYIRLQAMRFSDKMEVRFEISPDTQDVPVPKMILQPLVENSFIHGKLLRSENGFISIDSKITGMSLEISIVDNGVPITPDKQRVLYEQFQSQRSEYTFGIGYRRGPASGAPGDEKAAPLTEDEIGLANVFMRLLLYCGAESDVTVEPNSIGGTTVRISFPCKPS